MSTYYLLPPRPLLADRLASFLHAVLPGLDWDTASLTPLIEAIGSAASDRADVFVVFRDDLPPGESPTRALQDGFGAAVDDAVIEVRPGGAPGALVARRWHVGARAA